MTSRRTPFCVPLLFLAAVVTTAGVGRSDVIVRLTLLNRYPVPANGVLKFSYEQGMEVRILAADGSEVAGQFVEEGVWRPTEPFTVGVYTADVIYEGAPSRAIDKGFEVVAAQQTRLDFIQVDVTPKVLTGPVLKEACCEEGAATVFGMACTQECKPLCVPLEYAAEQWVSVYGAMDYDDPMSDQLIVRIPTEKPEGYFTQGGWLIEGTPEEFCGAVEVYSWLDGSTTLLTECIPNPKPDLTPIPEAPTSFGSIFECLLPPQGYEMEWCAAQAHSCEIAVLSLPEPGRTETHQACSGYYDVCSRPDPLAETDSTTSDEGTGLPQGPSRAGRSLPEAAGCSCTVGSGAPAKPAQWLATWIFTALCAARTRRRRVRARAAVRSTSEPAQAPRAAGAACEPHDPQCSTIRRWNNRAFRVWFRHGPRGV